MLIIAGAVLLVAAAGLWLYGQAGYRHQAGEMERLQAYVDVGDDEDAGDPLDEQQEDAVTTDDAAGDAEESPTAPQIDWAGLKAQSQDIVAWLQIPGTPVNYAVFQGPDNDYWLRRDIEGNYSVGGQLFIDSADAAPGLVDQQTVMYGHHLKDGTMFKAVADLDQQENFDATQTVWYCTEQQGYELEPLFVFYTQPEDVSVRQADWASADEFHAYLSEQLGKAVCARADAADIIGRCEHVLTLVTCNYYDGYGRTLVVCVPKSEAEA